MADIFYDTSGDFSSLTPKKIVASLNTPYLGNQGYSSYDLLNTARTIDFTPSEAGKVIGFFLCIKSSHSSTQSVTAKLQQYSGGSWIDVSGATKTLTYDEIIGSNASYYNTSSDNGGTTGWCWKYFELGTPADVTTDANTWRIHVQSTNNQASIWRNNSSGWLYAVVIDSDTSYSSGDNIFIKDGVTIIIDQSITATKWINGVGVTVEWENPPSSSYTFTCSVFYWGCEVAFRYGSSSNRISYSVRGTINVSGWGAMLTWNYCDMPHELEIYGEVQTLNTTTVKTTANSGQKILVVNDNVEGVWQAGDKICVYGAWGYDISTISSVSGDTITVSSNFSYKHAPDWIVINMTRAEKMGAVISGSGSPNSGNSYFTKFVVSGVKLSVSFGYYISHSGITASSANKNRITPFFIDNFYVETSSSATITITSYNAGSISLSSLERKNAGAVVSNIYQLSTLNNSGFRFAYTTWTPATISNIYLVQYVNAAYFYTTNSTIKNLQFSTNAWEKMTNWNGFNFNINGCSVSNLKMNNINCYIAGSGNTFSNMTFDNMNAVDINSSSMLNTFDNILFGQERSNNYSLYLYSYTYVQLTFKNSKFDTTPFYGLSDLMNGSFIKVSDYNQTSNDHRNFYPYGNIVSTGDGLSDTTVHTSGTGKFALKFVPTSSTNNLEWSFSVPTGNIKDKTMTVAVWCKVNSSNYWGGTDYEMPRLTVDYDNGTEVYAEASKTTDWQQLYVTFTPETSYGEITVTISGRTDATGSNAYFYVDDMTLLYPSNYALDLGGLDNWANALPVTPPIAIPLSAYSVSNAVWEELVSSHTTAGSMGEKVGQKLLTTTKFLGLK